MGGMGADVRGRMPGPAAWQEAAAALGRRGRGLTQLLEGSGVTRFLVVFYRFSSGATAINEDLVAKVRCACCACCAVSAVGRSGADCSGRCVSLRRTTQPNPYNR